MEEIRSKKIGTGFTLTEVMVTLIVSGVLFFTVGTLLLNINTSMTRNEEAIALIGELRFFRNIIQKELRKAQSVTITGGSGGTAIQMLDIFSGDIFSFTHDGAADEVIYKNESTLDEMMVLADAKDLRFYYHPDPAVSTNTAVKIFVEQEKVTDEYTQAVVNSTTSFIVQLRNKK